MKSFAEDAELASKRSEPRDHCEIEASIYYLPKTRLSCTIKDLSQRGAKIRVDAKVKLPRHIFLLIPITDDICETRHCELRWRIENVAGLRFLS